MAKRTGSGAAALVPLLLYLVLFLPLSSLVPGALQPPAGRGQFSSPGWHLSYWIAALPQIALFLALIASLGAARDGTSGAPPKRSVPRRAASLLLRSLCWAAAAGCIALLLSLPGLIARRAGFPAGLAAGAPAGPSPAVLPQPGLLLACLATGLCTGYREELFFRFLLRRSLSESLGGGAGTWGPLLAQAALFSLAHASGGWKSIAFAGLLGLLFGWRALRAEDPHELALGHGLYDFLAMAAALSSS